MNTPHNQTPDPQQAFDAPVNAYEEYARRTDELIDAMFNAAMEKHQMEKAYRNAVEKLNAACIALNKAEEEARKTYNPMIHFPRRATL